MCPASKLSAAVPGGELESPESNTVGQEKRFRIMKKPGHGQESNLPNPKELRLPRILLSGPV